MKTWLTLQILTFEIASLYLLGQQQMTPLLWLAVISSHGIAAGSFTVLCWLVLPNAYKTPVLPALLFIFTLAFTMPVIGMVCLATVFVVALYFPRAEIKKRWHHTYNLALPMHPEQLEAGFYGYAALKDILLFNPSDEKRLMATNSCRFLPHQDAMPLLKLALTDRTDDIRLLAYAVIEKIEFNINRKIALLKKKQERKANAETLQRIAESYWELCYLGIAEGPIRDFYLTEASRFLQQAHQLQPSAAIELKLGRILLEQQDYDQAQHYLNNALDRGLPERQVSPYLAEVMFGKARYQEVATLLQSLPARQSDLVTQLKEYWRSAAS
ncbi:hypothetical protein [Arsukibacterium sp.]|uniref:hypothetical protein n=1 Tax=Arsukibacterium sp. TaxID=1977258 RepID=UPI00299F2374|nr:hypothetical protein [Arsukibacterium sp.]MDX1678970.1 hypothetical protein [Arsukibacterium sp.]